MQVVVRIEEETPSEGSGGKQKTVMSMTADHTIAAGALRALADKWDPPKKVMRGD